MNCIHIGHSHMPRHNPKMPKEYAIASARTGKEEESTLGNKGYMQKGFQW
ncbi:MAG: hypothetical protein K0B15_16045 [Lentimicrobium sp.]|nr:hypothetical protein [Lentimicrobium sp.]